MSESELGGVLRLLNKACALQGTCDLTDRELVERFLSQRDEGAFTFLVRRHGPMIFDVCRRFLGDDHDAEDALQATFLVLVSRARSIRSKESVGSWLYGVAKRIALRSRAQKAARQNREKEAGNLRGRDQSMTSMQELRLVLDEVIDSLSEKCRAPIVLCCLEGKSLDRAARELGCPKTSLVRRLTQARELLRWKLEQRGITLAIGALATSLAEMASATPLPAILTIKTVKAATLMATGQAVAGGCISAHVLALAEETTTGMLLAKGKLVVMVMALGFSIGGAGWAGYGRLAGTKQPAPASNAQLPAPKKQAEVPAKKDQPIAVDQYGDPLPEGAVARLGTLRWRTDGEVDAIAFAPDGKTVAVGAHLADSLRLFDAASGELKKRLGPWIGSFNKRLAFSPNGSRLALLTEGPVGVQVWDLSGLRAAQFIDVAKVPEAEIKWLGWSNDDKLLGAFLTKETVLLRELESGKEQIFKAKNPPAPKGPLAYAAKILAIAGTGRLDPRLGHGYGRGTVHSPSRMRLCAGPGSVTRRAQYCFAGRKREREKNSANLGHNQRQGHAYSRDRRRSPNTVAFAPRRAKRLPVSAGAYQVRFWNVADGRESGSNDGRR